MGLFILSQALFVSYILLGILINIMNSPKKTREVYRKEKTMKEVKLHKHVDKKGFAFGKEHPINSTHKKKSTQEAHERSLGVKK